MLFLSARYFAALLPMVMSREPEPLVGSVAVIIVIQHNADH